MLETAVALADERGADALSMRALAKQLGVEAMSLYNHVSNKEDLLDGMVDIVFGEVELPTTDVDWRTALRRQAVSRREALNRHTWAIGRMEARTNPGPSDLRLREAVLGCLREAGFSPAMTVHASSVQDAYVYGFALQERNLGLATPDEFAAAAERSVERIEDRLGDYPHLAEIVGEHVAKEGYDPDAEFLYGLDLILDGLELRRRAAGS